MKKSILEIYALAVCFVTVVCFVIAAGFAIYALVGMAKPEFTMPAWTYNQLQSNEAFQNSPLMGPRSAPAATPGPNPPAPAVLSQEELTQKRLAALNLALAGEQRESGQTAVKTGIVILIDLLVFLGHWRIGRHARQGLA